MCAGRAGVVIEGPQGYSRASLSFWIVRSLKMLLGAHTGAEIRQ